MLKYLYKTAFVAIFGILSLQESFAQCSIKTDLQVFATSPICVGNSTTITIAKSEPGIDYQAFEEAVALSEIITGTGSDLSFQVAGLLPGSHTIIIKATNLGCTEAELLNKNIIIVDGSLDYSFEVSGDAICSNNPNAEITITGSSSELEYYVYLNGGDFLISFFGDVGANTTVKKIPSSQLNIGVNVINVYTTLQTICQSISTTTSTQIIVNASPTLDTPILIGDTVTLPTASAKVVVTNPERFVSYQAYSKNNPIGIFGLSSNDEPISLIIPVGPPNGLEIGVNEVTVSFTIEGCETKTVSATTQVVVKPEIITSIEDKQITSNFAVYPNPFSSEITITSKLNRKMKFQITDAIGNIVHQESNSNAEDLKLNPDLKSGIYFLQMESEGVQETVKLIKQ